MPINKFTFLSLLVSFGYNFSMKKITLFLLLLTTLFADVAPYIGTHIGVYTENFSKLVATSSSALANIKLGYGNSKGYAVEFSLDYLNNDAKIFSSVPSTTKDGNKIGFNVSLIKVFDFDIYALPFVKIGFGSGVEDIDRVLQSSLAFGSFQLTLGTYIPLKHHFNLELGYEARANSYEGINTIATKTSYNSVMNTLYFGINYRY